MTKPRHNIAEQVALLKYALLKLRQLETFREQSAFGALAPEIAQAIKTLEDAGVLDWGLHGSEGEFMVIRLKDKYAQAPLCEYAKAAEMDGEWEFGSDVRELASRAGQASPWCQKPD